jgi:prevent-host-death family protein
MYMSTQVSITEARRSLRKLIRAAQQGARIDITNRGEVVARLVRPANDLGSTADALLRARARLAPTRRRGSRHDVSSRKSLALTARPSR